MCRREPRDLLRARPGNDGKRAGFLERMRIGNEPVGFLWLRGLPPEAAGLVNRLREETEMPHDRYPDVDQPFHDVDDRAATFELDGGRAAFLYQAPGVAHGLARADLVRQERHVRDDECALGAAAHGFG